MISVEEMRNEAKEARKRINAQEQEQIGKVVNDVVTALDSLLREAAEEGYSGIKVRLKLKIPYDILDKVMSAVKHEFVTAGFYYSEENNANYFEVAIATEEHPGVLYVPREENSNEPRTMIFTLEHAEETESEVEPTLEELFQKAKERTREMPTSSVVSYFVDTLTNVLKTEYEEAVKEGFVGATVGIKLAVENKIRTAVIPLVYYNLSASGLEFGASGNNEICYFCVGSGEIGDVKKCDETIIMYPEKEYKTNETIEQMSKDLAVDIMNTVAAILG